MIHEALTIISDKLNTYFTNRFSLNEERLVLSNIVNQDGSVAINESDKMILTLINLQEEAIASMNSRMVGVNRPVNLNLFILFSAYFTGGNYEEALKFLSATIGFFQSNPVINHHNTPELDDSIEKLSCEIVNTDLQSLSHLWGVLGGKHMPSVMYKIRMVTFNEFNSSGLFNRIGLPVG
jgi:hypothetical protein